MPQSSITAWLSKSAGSKLSKPATSHDQDAGNARVVCKDSIPETKRDESSKEAAVKRPEYHLPGSMIADESKLPPNVDLRACTKDDIAHFKRLNSLLLPIPYPESFYREIIDDPLTNNITLVATWHDDPQTVSKEKGRFIGAIRCRIFDQPHPSAPSVSPRKSGSMLYLSTLVLLSPYRSHGIASCMLGIMISRAIRNHGITSVGAHVWEANDEGLEWYRKRGFRKVAREDGYYRRLKPSTAIIMQRDVGVMDLLDR